MCAWECGLYITRAGGGGSVGPQPARVRPGLGEVDSPLIAALCFSPLRPPFPCSGLVCVS